MTSTTTELPVVTAADEAVVAVWYVVVLGRSMVMVWPLASWRVMVVPSMAVTVPVRLTPPAPRAAPPPKPPAGNEAPAPRPAPKLPRGKPPVRPDAAADAGAVTRPAAKATPAAATRTARPSR